MATRLLLIADDRNDGEGLAHARLLAQRLDPRTFPLEIVRLTEASGRPPPIGLADGAAGVAVRETVVTVAARWRLDPRALWRLKQIVERQRPAVVHTLGELAGRYGRAAASLAGQVAIMASHLDSDFQRFGLAASLTRKWLAARSTVVFATVAEHEAAIAIGWPAERCRTITSPAPPFKPASLGREEACRSLDVPARTRFIAVLSPLEPRHRIKEAIWAYDPLRCVRPDVHLLVIGDGGQRRELELFRDSQDCRDSIHFITAPYAAAAWWQHIDLVWATDPAPRPAFATLRAVASGIPLVAVDTPGHRLLVELAENGILTPVGARPALAQATVRLLETAANGRSRRGQAAADDAQQNSAGQFADLYRSLY